MLVVAHNCVHGNDSRVKPEGNLHDFITRIKSRVLRRQSILRSRHISVAFTRVKRCVHCARFQGLINIHAYYTGYYAWGLPVAVMHVPLRHIHLTLIARPRHETLIIACNSPLNARACTLIKRKFLKSISFGSTLMSNEERYVLCNGCVTVRGKYTSCQGRYQFHRANLYVSSIYCDITLREITEFVILWTCSPQWYSTVVPVWC
jgi:hypothetical protein